MCSLHLLSLRYIILFHISHTTKTSDRTGHVFSINFISNLGLNKQKTHVCFFYPLNFHRNEKKKIFRFKCSFKQQMLHGKDEPAEALNWCLKLQNRTAWLSTSLLSCHKQRHDGVNYITKTKLLGHVPRPMNLVHFPSVIIIPCKFKTILESYTLSSRREEREKLDALQVTKKHFHITWKLFIG